MSSILTLVRLLYIHAQISRRTLYPILELRKENTLESGIRGLSLWMETRAPSWRSLRLVALTCVAGPCCALKAVGKE